MRKRQVGRVLVVIALFSGTLVLTTAAIAEAKPGCKDKITVSHLSDVDGGKHQLREAISDVCDGGTVKIRPGTIILERGRLEIPEGKTVTIVGLPANGNTPKVTIDGNQTSQVFVVWDEADLTLDSVIATGGRNKGGGGGITNLSGTVTITDSIITGNSVVFRAGGGGIANYHGTVTITRSTISDNSSITVGGGIYSTGAVTIIDSTINGNTARYGGGIANYGTVTLDGATTVTNNTANSFGGGIYWLGGSVVVNPPATVTGNTPDNIYPPLP